ncbi:MAG: Abi family protein [Muribaculaceae bacterium]|nr:Abi family protein [Muribaculaceae bacterium]
MKYSEYEKAFSPARLNKYLVACRGNTAKAMTLYRHNVKLCQKFYGILNIFEVVLRNAINAHYQRVFNDSEWVENQLRHGGMIENAPQKNEVLRIIATLRQNGRYTNDRVVSSVSFGFWTHLFTRQPYRLGGQNLLRIFPNRTPGLGQRAVFNELQEIKTFRNRIAHHEAICFDENGNIDMSRTQNKYALILKYINFLGYKSSHLFYGIDILPDSTITKIEALK